MNFLIILHGSTEKQSWSYLIAEKEVTINKADKKDNSFQNRPSAIFSMYKEGYKCRLIEDKPDLAIIDLYPEDIKSEHSKSATDYWQSFIGSQKFRI